jgi:hypothetical protein
MMIMINEWKGFERKRSRPHFMYCPGVCPVVTEENFNIVSILAEIRSEHLPNASQECHRFCQFAPLAKY